MSIYWSKTRDGASAIIDRGTEVQIMPRGEKFVVAIYFKGSSQPHIPRVAFDSLAEAKQWVDKNINDFKGGRMARMSSLYQRLTDEQTEGGGKTMEEVSHRLRTASEQHEKEEAEETHEEEGEAPEHEEAEGHSTAGAATPKDEGEKSPDDGQVVPAPGKKSEGEMAQDPKEVADTEKPAAEGEKPGEKKPGEEKPEQGKEPAQAAEQQPQKTQDQKVDEDAMNEMGAKDQPVDDGAELSPDGKTTAPRTFADVTKDLKEAGIREIHLAAVAGGKHKGVEYTIDLYPGSMLKIPGKYYRGVCRELQIATGMCDSIDQARKEIVKLIDESAADVDMAGKKDGVKLAGPMTPHLQRAFKALNDALEAIEKAIVVLDPDSYDEVGLCESVKDLARRVHETAKRNL